MDKVNEETLIIGDSHVRPLKLVKKENVKVISISGATMSGTINPASRTDTRNITVSSIEQFDPKRIIMCLGEVDVGFLCLVKNESEGFEGVYRAIEEAVTRYKSFVEFLIDKYGVEILVCNIFPTIMTDESLKKSKIELRQGIEYSMNERNNFISFANELINQKFNSIIDLNSIFKKNMDRRKFRHINPRDHHFDSYFFVSSFFEALSKEGVLKDHRLRNRYLYLINDLKSFVK